MRLHLSLREIRKGYKLVKGLARQSFDNGDIKKSLEYINHCTVLAQQFNWIYCDDELEDLLSMIGRAVLSDSFQNDYEPISNRVVFYDDFCVSFVLAIQYLDALAASGKEVLYITTNEDGVYDTIIERIKGYPRFKVLIIHKTDNIQVIHELYESIISFQPQKLILHIFAYSSISPVLSILPGTIERFIVNLADQTFWLGSKAIDYVLEFRQFGVSVSQQRRGINENQQLLIPFYPVIDGYSFQGYPEGCPSNGRVLFFSGGDLYKVLDKRRMFWHLIKRLMDKYPEVVFWFSMKSGSDPSFINKFISDNHYEGRFFYTSFRPDINEILAHVDVFMGTCPVCGSLMSQLAARNATPILQYYYPGTPDDETEQAICINDKFSISFQTEKEFLEEADKLIKDIQYRKKQGNRLKKAMVSVEQFNSFVREALDTHHSPQPLKPFNVNYRILDSRWFELEKIGQCNTLQYLYSIIGFNTCIRKIPTLFIKKKLNHYLNK